MLRRFVFVHAKINGNFVWAADPEEWVKNGTIDPDHDLLFKAAAAGRQTPTLETDLYLHWMDPELAAAWIEKGWSLVEDYAAFGSLSEADKWRRTEQAWQAIANVFRALNVRPYSYGPYYTAMLDRLSSSIVSDAGDTSIDPEMVWVGNRGRWRQQALDSFWSAVRLDPSTVEVGNGAWIYNLHTPRITLDNSASVWINPAVLTGNHRWDEFAVVWGRLTNQANFTLEPWDAGDVKDDLICSGWAFDDCFEFGVRFGPGGRDYADMARELLESMLGLSPLELVSKVRRYVLARNFSVLKEMGRTEGMDEDRWRDVMGTAMSINETLEAEDSATDKKRFTDASTYATAIGAVAGSIIPGLGTKLGAALGAGVGLAIGFFLNEIAPAITATGSPMRDAFGRPEPLSLFEAFRIDDAGLLPADSATDPPESVLEIMPEPPGGVAVQSPPAAPGAVTGPAPTVNLPILPLPTQIPTGGYSGSGGTVAQPSGSKWLLWLALAGAVGAVVWDQTRPKR